MNEKKRLVWSILIRVAVVSLFLISTVILNTREPESAGAVELTGLYRLIIPTYLFSIASLIILKLSGGLHQTFTYAQIIWDLLLVTLLLLLTGGISSPYSFLYMLSIINASILLARREAIYTASLCGILYGAILDFQYYGKLAVFGLNQAQHYDARYILYTIFVNILAFYLTAFLTGYLAERVKKSESALKEKVIDYEELERLNSSVVSNIDSGLISINNDGSIRVFNHHAAELTGITQEEAYDRPLTEVIDGFTLFSDKILTFSEGEIDYNTKNGEQMIFGFRSVPFPDKEGNPAGVIIHFKDLTQMKRMKEQLKRADELAAIGELSARIAHEIKNPLASISGSVQLISLDENIDGTDKKLLEIIMRESERLNGLINDFLAYARPSQPIKIPVLLKQLLVDMATILAADPRFNNVTIQNNCEEWLSLAVDRDQMRQVFWNLFLNSAEAMTTGGTIQIDAEIDKDGKEAGCQEDKAKIIITDNGSGMTRNDLKRVFEPFFTTKSSGTGLGLATVYRIIESHGGTILVESTVDVGTTFTIILPVT